MRILVSSRPCISARYERASLIVISNKPLGRWALVKLRPSPEPISHVVDTVAGSDSSAA